MPRHVRWAVMPYCAAAILFLLGAASVPQQAPADPRDAFERRNAMVPMRDGVRLNTDIYIPKNFKEPLPFVFLRSPYGIDEWPRGAFSAYLKDMVADGYIFVFQDIRGRFKSEGKFVMQRKPRDMRDPAAIDESSDAYDTIEWLLKNVPNNNGRAGMLGISYGGWLAAMALLDPHPALKAVSEQASPADMFLGDDFHHNGAFRLSYGFEYAAMMETDKENTQFQFDRYDTYDWYLSLGSLANVNAKYLRGKIPTWNDYVAHPNYDSFWQQVAFAPYLNKITVPNLNVAGWWDQEDFYGPMKIYELLERHDARNLNYLVVGPWNHGGWAGGEGANLGKIEFDSATGKHFRQNVQAPFFAWYLKDRGKLEQPEALTFRTGANAWQNHSAWPPKQGFAAHKLYFQAGGQLSFNPPSDKTASAFDSYVSDPARPVPYRLRPIEPTYDPRGSEWYTWLVQDQRFVHNRPDVLTFETAPLAENVTVTGSIMAKLFASTTGTDADWIVKLIDVYPEDYPKNSRMGGYQLMVASEVMRGRFRRSFEKPEPIPAGRVLDFTVDMRWADHTFLKGHKIMVQVQSTWFPIIDRNPQKYVPNIFEAKESDFQKATQRIYRSNRFPSHVAVSVEER